MREDEKAALERQIADLKYERELYRNALGNPPGDGEYTYDLTAPQHNLIVPGDGEQAATTCTCAPNRDEPHCSCPPPATALPTSGQA